MKKAIKILHLFSDWKWTGPAEPTVMLCEALQERGYGVTLAYGKPPAGAADSIAKRISGRNVKGTDQFRLRSVGKADRMQNLAGYFRDLAAVRRFIDREEFEVVNVHHSHDHLVGGMAARLAKRRPVVIRSDHNREAIRPSLGNRFLVSKLTDGIMTFSKMAQEKDARNHLIPVERVGRIRVALELDRYDPSRSFRDMRKVFGIKQDDTVIGLVARFQKYRRTDVFLRALVDLVKEFPRVKALLVGRSSQIRESVIEPTQKLGLTDHVVLAGYQRENYVDTMAAMDIFVFLMAGSDGTARALREAMAMGLPAVVARRGILPELVEDGVTGFVVDDDPEEICCALRRLVTQKDLRVQMGRRAREKALGEFEMAKQTEEIVAFYQRMIDMGPRMRGGPRRQNQLRGHTVPCRW
jgi:glycosyltransferase involved in cell wall biosynthesis